MRSRSIRLPGNSAWSLHKRLHRVVRRSPLRQIAAAVRVEETQHRSCQSTFAQSLGDGRGKNGAIYVAANPVQRQTTKLCAPFAGRTVGQMPDTTDRREDSR